MKKLKINYFPEFLALAFGRKKPSMVSVNLTDKCNQSCVYCEIGQKISSADSHEFLTKEDLFWIIDQMYESKITRLSLCGGEPFLFSNIFEVISYAYNKNIKCNITSNGMTIYTISATDLEILKKCESQINISIDSFNNEIQTKTRGNNFALTNAIKSIEVLKKYGIPVTVLSAISKYNVHDLYNSLISAYELGITQVLYQPIISYSNYPDKQTIEEKHELNVEIENLYILKEQLQKIKSFEYKHRINTNVYRIIPWIEHYIKATREKKENWFFHSILKTFYCREVYAVIDISYTGGIQACGLTPAEISIQKDTTIGLLAQWEIATFKLKQKLDKHEYPACCNGCCHKFSRNMLASVILNPIKNRKAFVQIVILLSVRIITRILKKMNLNEL